MRPLSLLVGFGWLLSAGCAGRGGDAEPAIAVRDSAGLTIVDNDLTRLTASCARDSVASVSIGVAEGEPEYELHRVFGARRLSDGRLVLVNQGTQQLRFYDRAGKYLKSAGRPGQGPGEFSNAFTLYQLPGDTLYAGDYRPWQFLVFDGQGNWIRTVRPEPIYGNSPQVISVLDDGRMVLGTRALSSSGDTDFQLNQLTVVVHGRDGALTDTLGSYPDGRWGTVDKNPNAMRLFPLFESFARIEARGHRIVVSHNSAPELKLYAAGSKIALERVIRFSVPDRKITAAEIEAERRRIAEPYQDRDAESRARFLEPLISDQRPIADEFPAFASVRLGRDGRVWVREYRRPTGPALQRWVGFDAEGRFACRFELPLRHELVEVGADYLLVEDNDEDGVERVLQFAISRPAGR